MARALSHHFASVSDLFLPIVLGCSVHGSITEAKNPAERIYPGLSACWVNAHVTEAQAEQYLDELFADDWCSFCGKRADGAPRRDCESTGGHIGVLLRARQENATR